MQAESISRCVTGGPALQSRHERILNRCVQNAASIRISHGDLSGSSCAQEHIHKPLHGCSHLCTASVPCYCCTATAVYCTPDTPFTVLVLLVLYLYSVLHPVKPPQQAVRLLSNLIAAFHAIAPIIEKRLRLSKLDFEDSHKQIHLKASNQRASMTLPHC